MFWTRVVLFYVYGVMLFTTPVPQLLIYDTAPRVRHTPPIDPRLPRLCWHDVGLSLKLSCTQNGQSLEETRGIYVNPPNTQTGVVNMSF